MTECARLSNDVEWAASSIASIAPVSFVALLPHEVLPFFDLPASSVAC
jgi:hypothetical protein